MFEPNEESVVLEIVSGFFNIPHDEMMKIGDQVKSILFADRAKHKEECIQQLKDALEVLPKEHAVIAGMFISGLLRCNLAQHIQEQYMQAMTEEDHDSE